MYEVYTNRDNTDLMVEDSDNSVKPLKEMGSNFLSGFDSAIELQFPETYQELCNERGIGKSFCYGRVRRFAMCNFAIKDGVVDIDEDWNFKLEKVPCPARTLGICKGTICNPKLTNRFTDREIEVLRLFVKGLRREVIAGHLFISERTVGNHVNNMYRKIEIPEDVNPEIALVNFAYAKKIV